MPTGRLFYLGGDSDTLAFITGGIAQAFYCAVPESIATKVFVILDEKLGVMTGKFRQN
jgi:ADP-ribosylglycohydrolase